MHGWPLKMRFPESRLYISVLMPAAVGAFGGLLAAVLGIGGGFVMVPAMIYLIGMPTAVVVGTSLFQICFVAAITGFLQAYANHFGRHPPGSAADRRRRRRHPVRHPLRRPPQGGADQDPAGAPGAAGLRQARLGPRGAAARPVLAQLRLTRHGIDDTLGAAMAAPLPELSVVVPAYNEEAVLVAFHRRLAASLDGLSERAEILFVNDGSSDRTLAVLDQLRACDPRVAVLDLSRNFGKEVALTAGLHHARGERWS